MRVLTIETSCDETAMAVVEAKGGIRSPRFKVLKSEISSQIELHRPFGGVMPGLAKREHLKNLPPIEKTLDIDWEKVDLMAVIIGPGLEPALWTGIEYAKKLAKEHKKPLLGVNHLEAHLYSPLLSLKERDRNIPLPAIGLIVSGGHTILLALEKIDRWKKIGETRDDAVGEAFDKVARLVGLPYPGGPEIQKTAEKGNPNAIVFPKPMINQKNLDFSFSGLKTAIFYYLRDKKMTPKLRADVAASFQKTVIDILITKTLRAAWQYGAKSVVLAGGVAANKPLRDALKKKVKKDGLNFYVAGLQYSTDNAAMAAAAAYVDHLKGKRYRITAQANLNL
ncbi:MAG: tRNA (adenosine(37)-N6)-threonylcarbamoyltransferase complex transferase subunit TsaD [Candidatus Colwellbacteria bacterium]|nr:tRNA (adenosine(37)-N6)-threonylcarbamoyltransferase complex transferase subunit TsaD [Candidatus Colwellbacteria bacterium]